MHFEHFPSMLYAPFILSSLKQNEDKMHLMKNKCFQCRLDSSGLGWIQMAVAFREGGFDVRGLIGWLGG